MVTTWILILSLFAGRSYDSGVSVHSVAPFATVEECQRAGDVWLSQIRKGVADESLGWYVKARAACVKTTALEQTVTYGTSQ